MTEIKEKKFEYGKEVEAIFLSLFAIFAFLEVPDASKTIFAVFVSLLYFLLSIFIKDNKLRLAKNIFYTILAFFNVSSLLYMVQYFVGMKVDSQAYQYIFKAFFKDGIIQLGFVIWIFVLTLYLMILKQEKPRNHGDDYGR